MTTYREALGAALHDAMSKDPTIIIMGEEVGRYGGAYGVTKGLIKAFGPDRVLDTPISEAGIIGAAVGAAMTGLRPVAELMYVDFAGIAMDQIANQAAKIRYMFGGQIGVPMVLRTQGGTGRSGAAQHSQSLEAWFMHTPGLRVAMPATVSDAYGLLTAALTSPDPVIFIEHKGLYTMQGEVDKSAAPDWGKAKVRRKGRDISIITYSRMVHFALEAADKLAGEDVPIPVSPDLEKASIPSPARIRQVARQMVRR
ncbi:MAG: alpha-ketoacid dehydrogenase subunit beta [Alphaproteobacteria bacterium]